MIPHTQTKRKEREVGYNGSHGGTVELLWFYMRFHMRFYTRFLRENNGGGRGKRRDFFEKLLRN